MKNLTVDIFERGTNYRKGILKLNGMQLGYSMEPKDEFLTKDTSLKTIMGVKSKGICAIPYGTYKVVLIHSGVFNMVVPMLTGVPGFVSVEIHPGNTSSDSKGCILVGSDHSVNSNWIWKSRTCFELLMSYLSNGIIEPITLTINP
jgi:hypothetical protein